MTNALFKLDDTRMPGWVKVKLLGKDTGREAKAIKKALGWDVWKIEMLEIIRPSPIKSLNRGVRSGRKLAVSEVNLIFHEGTEL